MTTPTVSRTAPLGVEAPAPAAPEAPAPPFPPALVEDLLRNLGRAVKTHQLYLPNNPVYQKSIENVRAAFAPVWQHTDELALQITEAEFRWAGVAVMHEPSRAESLPWVFFKDGLRELTLRQGFEQDELVTLFDILQRVRKALPEEDDLLTLLWEQEFAFLRYRFIDIGLDSVPPIEPTPEEERKPALPIVEVQQEVQEEVAANPGIVRMDSLDATLYFLDETEIEYLRTEVQKEQAVSQRANVIAIVLDIFEVQSDPAVRAEVCELLEQYLPHVLASRDVPAAAYLLREVGAALERVPDLPAEYRDRLARLPSALGAPGVLEQLLQSLEDSGTLLAQRELDTLFDQLPAATLRTVLGWLRQVQSRELRTLLERTAARLASANTAELLRLIAGDDPVLAVEAIRRAGELRTPAAVAPLLKVLTGADVALRQAAAQALADIGSPGAMRALESALDDEDRDVRVTAVKAIGTREHRAALPRIEAVVKGKAVREADLTEKMAFFEAFGTLAGAAGIPPLDELLNGRTALLRLRVDPDIRACAAMALGRIGTPDAEAALRRAADDKDVRVRAAINRVLRGGAA